MRVSQQVIFQRPATSSGRPVLLRMSMDTGHGMGTPLKTRVEEEADTYAFLMAQLGMALP